jgi:hypothetical protein
MAPNGYGKTQYSEEFSHETNIPHVEGDRFIHPDTGIFLDATAVVKLKKKRNEVTIRRVFKTAMTVPNRTVIVSSMGGVMQDITALECIAASPEFNVTFRVSIIVPQEIYEKTLIDPTSPLTVDNFQTNVIDKWTNRYDTLFKSRNGRGMIIYPGKENAKSFTNMTLHNLRTNLPNLIKVHATVQGLSQDEYVRQEMIGLFLLLEPIDHTDQVMYEKRKEKFKMGITRLHEWTKW